MSNRKGSEFHKVGVAWRLKEKEGFGSGCYPLAALTLAGEIRDDAQLARVVREMVLHIPGPHGEWLSLLLCDLANAPEFRRFGQCECSDCCERNPDSDVDWGDIEDGAFVGNHGGG